MKTLLRQHKLYAPCNINKRPSIFKLQLQEPIFSNDLLVHDTFQHSETLHKTLCQLPLFAKQISCGSQRQVALGIILKMLHSQNIFPHIWETKIAKQVNFCMASSYGMRSISGDYCSFWLWVTVLTKFTWFVHRHTHNVGFITMRSYNMFSVVQYYMWYEFEINETFLSICITKNVILL